MFSISYSYLPMFLFFKQALLTLFYFHRELFHGLLSFFNVSYSLFFLWCYSPTCLFHLFLFHFFCFTSHIHHLQVFKVVLVSTGVCVILHTYTEFISSTGRQYRWLLNNEGVSMPTPHVVENPCIHFYNPKPNYS